MMNQRTNFKMSDPTTWAIDPTRIVSDLTARTSVRRWPTAESDGMSGLIPTATIAANVSAQDATGGGDIATMPIARPLTGNESKLHETATNTKRHKAVTNCEQCGDGFTPRRPHGRFCSSYCRRLAWLERNPEKAADLAERDRARLREHIIGCGGDWRD